MIHSTTLTPNAAGGASSAALERTPVRAWYSLFVLTIVTLIAFIDRNILILQAETIRKVMELSDLQLGLLQGTAVAAFAALATFPLGWLADRYDRRLVLGGCALFWSAAVVGCGMAQTYEQLLLASALVGAGEAGLVPIAYAMIPDMFNEKKRPLANSVFALASMSATSLAMALCGQVIGLVETLRHTLPYGLNLLESWRLGFFAVALPAPLLALMIATIYLRRRVPGAAARTSDKPTSIAKLGENVTAILPHLKANRTTFLLFTGGLFTALFGFAAIGSWLPVIYLRDHGVSAKDLGAALGVIALVAVLVGFPVSVYGTRYFRNRIGPGVNIRSLWLTCVFAVVAIALMVFATSSKQMFAIHGAYLVTLTAALLVYPTTLQALAPGPLRARTVALVGMISSSGAAIAPPVTGFVSDYFKGGLMLSAAVVSIPALCIAVFLLAKCERHYVRTAEASRLIDAEQE